MNGKSPTVPINEYKMEKGGEIEIKRLVPVLKKKVNVKVKVSASAKSDEE